MNLSKGNYDESVIWLAVFGFVFTVVGDGPREDYLAERRQRDGFDSCWLL
jgi:hypothetical protein